MKHKLIAILSLFLLCGTVFGSAWQYREFQGKIYDTGSNLVQEKMYRLKCYDIQRTNDALIVRAVRVANTTAEFDQRLPWFDETIIITNYPDLVVLTDAVYYINVFTNYSTNDYYKIYDFGKVTN